MKNQANYSLLSSVFEKESQWLDSIVCKQLDLFFSKNQSHAGPTQSVSNSIQHEIITILPPEHNPLDSTYAHFINTYALSFSERLLLALTIIPHIYPDLLFNRFKLHKSRLGIRRENHENYPQMGLLAGENFRGLLPTGLTFLFLSGGGDLENRLKAASLFLPDSTLIKELVIHLEPSLSGEPFYSGRLILSKTYFDLFTSPNTLTQEV